MEPYQWTIGGEKSILRISSVSQSFLHIPKPHEKIVSFRCRALFSSHQIAALSSLLSDLFPRVYIIQVDKVWWLTWYSCKFSWYSLYCFWVWKHTKKELPYWLSSIKCHKLCRSYAFWSLKATPRMPYDFIVFGLETAIWVYLIIYENTKYEGENFSSCTSPAQ